MIPVNNLQKKLSTPSVIPNHVFDANIDINFTFIYTGSQSVKNRAVIVNNETSETVYDTTIETLKLLHPIPSGTLENGQQYTIQIQVFDSNNNSSDLSEPVLFYCYSSPAFALNDFENPYSSSSISLNVTYTQGEGEPLKSYQYLVYDYNKIQLGKSDVYYTSGNSYLYYGLENNREYYVRCIGETVHGFILDTGYKKVLVSYNTIPSNILFQLKNHKCSGYISIDTNMTVIGYDVENENYLFSDGSVTLWDNSITYNGGFRVNDDFVLLVDAKKLPVKAFLTANDAAFSLRIVNVCGVYYCELRAGNYVIYKPLPKAQITTLDGKLITDNNGNKIEIINTSYEDDDFVVFEVKRIQHFYSLHVYYKADGFQLQGGML